MDDQITQPLQEAAYVAVGLGVLAFQRAQVARVDLLRWYAAERPRLKAQVDEVLVNMPPPVQEAVTQMGAYGKSAADQLRAAAAGFSRA